LRIFSPEIGGNPREIAVGGGALLKSLSNFQELRDFIEVVFTAAPGALL
jgi:hypothetical protein